MLNAEQHRRRFIARVIPLTCLFLVFAVFGRERLVCQNGDDTPVVAGIDDVRAGVFFKAILVTDGRSSDDGQKPVQPVGPCSTAIINHVFRQHLKQSERHDQPAPFPAVKRYLLFSCLRLSEPPVPA
jgi:hypothetical protein